MLIAAALVIGYGLYRMLRANDRYARAWEWAAIERARGQHALADELEAWSCGEEVSYRTAQFIKAELL